MKKTKFGLTQFTKTPPGWLVPTFSIVMLLIATVSFLITGDPALTNEFKVRFNHYMQGLAMLISGIAPLFGVDVKKSEDLPNRLR